MATQFDYVPDNSVKAVGNFDFIPDVEAMTVDAPGFWEKLSPNILGSVATMGEKFANLPARGAEYLESKFPQDETLAKQLGIKAADFPRIPKNDYYKLLKLPDEPTIGDTLTRFGGENLDAFLAPELKLGMLEKLPFAGRMLQKVIGNAIPQGAISAIHGGDPAMTTATQAPFSALSSLVTSSNPYVKGAARLGMLGGGAYAGYKGTQGLGFEGAPAQAIGALVGGGLSLLGANPQRMARETMLEGVDPALIGPKLEAARRLGLKYVTPAEIADNPFTASVQGAAGKTKEGAQIQYKEGKERTQSEKTAIKDFFNTIFNKNDKTDTGHLKTKERLYKEAYQARVSQNFLHDLNDNEIYKVARAKVESDPVYKEALKGVPEDSFAYQDQIKRALGDLEERAKGANGKATDESRLYNKFTKSYVKKLDKIEPKYKAARALAEREIAVDNMQAKLNESEITGPNFFRTLLRNDNKFAKLRHSLRNVPGAQQKLDDMRLIFPNLINPPSIRTAAGLAKTSMDKQRSSVQDAVNKIMNTLTSGRYDKAAINLITNPKWDQEFAAIKAISDTRLRAAKMLDLLGRASGQYAGEAE